MKMEIPVEHENNLHKRINFFVWTDSGIQQHTHKRQKQGTY
jgi:hypothetical protein